MAFGFTSVSSLLKDEAKKVQDAGAEAFGVAVINDLEGKHEPIASSNAQMHLFMQIKKGNIGDIYFQSSEQADVFMENIRSYFGKDEADAYMAGMALEGDQDTADHLSGMGFGNVRMVPSLTDRANEKP